MDNGFNFSMKALTSGVLIALNSYAAYADAESDLYYQGVSEYATVNDNITVRMETEITEPNPDYSYLFTGVRNRSANPVRIIWYGNPNDADGVIAQKGAINHGRIYGKLTVTGQDSVDKFTPEGSDTEFQDYRSSISSDGQGNAVDAYGWSAQPNKNPVEFTLDSVENTGTMLGEAHLHAGKGTNRSLILSNATANGISLYGSGDFGKYIAGVSADGGGIAADAIAGGSRSAVSMRSASLLDLRDAPTPDATHPASLSADDTDFYGKNVIIALDRVTNSDRIGGNIQSIGNKGSAANDDTEAQDYSTTSWASGNGVSLRALVLTQDRRSYSYERINQAKLGEVHNEGVITGTARLEAGAVTTTPSTNYTRSYDSGNAISVGVHSLRFAKHKTYGEIGNIDNTGILQGHLIQKSSDNNYRAIHQYSQSQAFGGGNGVSLFVEATQNIQSDADDEGIRDEGAVKLKLGRIQNVGQIRGFSDLTAGSGYGVINVQAQGAGNGISGYLLAGAAQTYEAQLGDVDNKGIISGYLKAKSGMGGGAKPSDILANKDIPAPEVQLVVIDKSNWNTRQRPAQVTTVPEGAKDCTYFYKRSNCTQINSVSDIRGSGNGISFITGRTSHDGTTLGNINNSGVISGYAEMYHGLTDAKYTRVDFLATGVGIAVDQNITSNITNKGIISGNHAATLAKSFVNDAYSISEPIFESGYSGQFKNYGLMAGVLIAGNYDGNRPDGNPSNQRYVYFNADNDPVTNHGTYVYLGKRIPVATSIEHTQAGIAVRSDFLNPGHSAKLRSLEDDIARLNSSRERETINTTYKTFAIADIKKIEAVYGAVSESLSEAERIDLYFKLYDVITDKDTADKYHLHYEDSFLSPAQSRDEEDKREILGRKNRFIHRQQEIQNIIDQLPAGESGFKTIYGQYIEFYNDQIKQLNEKLTKLNKHLKEKYNAGDGQGVDTNDGVVSWGNDVGTVASALPAAPYGVLDYIKVSENSTQTIDGIEYQIINAPVSGRDSEYSTTDSTLNHTIINGVGVAHGALIATQDLTLNNSVVNGFVTALNIQGNSLVALNNTVLNANGFAVKVLNGDAIEVRQPLAVLGDGQANVLNIGNHSVVNGNIELKDGDDQVTITDSSVNINGRYIDFGAGVDTFVLGKSIAQSAELIRVDYSTFGLERLIVNQPATIYAQAEFTPAKNTILNSKLVYQGDYVMQSGDQLQVGVHDVHNYGQLQIENGHADISKGTLVVDAAKLTRANFTQDGILENVVSVKPIIQESNEIVEDENPFRVIGEFASYSDNSELFDFTPVYRDNKAVDLRVVLAKSQNQSDSDHASGSHSVVNNSSGNVGIPSEVQSRLVEIAKASGSENSVAIAETLAKITDEHKNSDVVKGLISLSNQQQVAKALSSMSPIFDDDIILTGGRLLMPSEGIGESATGNNMVVASLGSWIPNRQIEHYSVWSRLIGSWGRKSDNADNLSYLSKYYGVLIGGDALVTETLRTGVFAGYANISADNMLNNQEINAHALQGGVYANWQVSRLLDLDMQAGYGYHFVHRQRDILVGEQRDIARSESGVQGGFAALTASSRLKFSSLIIKPFVGLDYHLVHNGAYVERGNSAFNLAVHDKLYHSLLLNGGIAGQISPVDGLKFNGIIKLGFEGLKDNSNHVSFVAYPERPFMVQDVEAGRVRGSIGLGTEYAVTNNALISAQYNLDLSRRYVGHHAEFKLDFRF